MKNSRLQKNLIGILIGLLLIGASILLLPIVIYHFALNSVKNEIAEYKKNQADSPSNLELYTFDQDFKVKIEGTGDTSHDKSLKISLGIEKGQPDLLREINTRKLQLKDIIYILLNNKAIKSNELTSLAEPIRTSLNFFLKSDKIKEVYLIEN